MKKIILYLTHNFSFLELCDCVVLSWLISSVKAFVLCTYAFVIFHCILEIEKKSNNTKVAIKKAKISVIFFLQSSTSKKYFF